MTKPLLVIALTLTAGACWNGENVQVRMGDVSFGQQLIDLKAALDQDAITQREYERTKESLLALTAMCDTIDDDHHGEERHHADAESDAEEEEDDSFRWF